MAASKATVEASAEAILRHVSIEVALAIVQDLQSVQGNQSFRRTLEGLHAVLVRRIEAAARLQ